MRQFIFFEKFTLIKLKKLLNVLERREIKKGQCLFKEGDSVQGIYLMESGEINYEKIVYENDITFANSKWM